MFDTAATSPNMNKLFPLAFLARFIAIYTIFVRPENVTNMTLTFTSTIIVTIPIYEHQPNMAFKYNKYTLNIKIAFHFH